jgi:hypothetical protein
MRRVEWNISSRNGVWFGVLTLLFSVVCESFIESRRLSFVNDAKFPASQPRVEVGERTLQTLQRTEGAGATKKKECSYGSSLTVR